MKRLPALILAVSGAALWAAETPLRPAGGEWPPVIGAWFWGDATLEPEGYKPFLDAAAAHSPYTLLSTSLRISKGEVTDPAIREQIGKAVRHAEALKLKIAFDFDVRLARRAFRARHPDELQEELVLKLAEPSTNGTAQVTFEGKDLADHMTGNTVPYQCLTSRLVRVYAFARGLKGIDPGTVRAVTGEGVRAVADGPRKLTVTVPLKAGQGACVIAAHTYLTPDVFAPHLLAFQREIIRQYAGLPLAGVMKDEWGFPPDHSGNPAHDRYWYSSALAKAYAEQTAGGDLVRDTLLMFAGEQGRERERQAAINRYRKLSRARNAAIEDDFYRAGKETFGPASFVVTHATWTSYPGVQEFRKHGLDWWEATRDLGQTDESAPYPCRTSLAKRWGFPLWYNQYYSSKTADYAGELWAGALSGGRLNVHPVYPRSDLALGEAHLALLREEFMTGMSRLRMLDFITRAPLDCPVAVVFGHACAMNWAGPSYNRVGLEVAAALGAEGYPADLVPSSLAGTPALRLDGDGYVCLGPQRYRAVVLYQAEFGDEKELAFFEQAARGRTAMFVVGEWTSDSAARPLAGTQRLGGQVRQCADEGTCVSAVARYLGETGAARVTAWKREGPTRARPPLDGHAVLTDGTYVRIAGAKHPAGDPIAETFTWSGHTVVGEATGIIAIRFGADGKVAALAAGGLKHLKTKGLEITMPERADVALVTDANGKTRGVLQGLAGDVPATLLAITADWQRLAVPPPLQEKPEAKLKTKENAGQPPAISPNEFAGSDVERINRAIEAAAAANQPVVIPRANIRGAERREVWLLDSAIRLRSNTTLILDNCRIKLSDRCRDNFMRSANCGAGIAEIQPLRNIHIRGIGQAVLEGADRPRATGDSAKTLGAQTYGTDAGAAGESQKGDWRNIGILLAFVEDFSIENLAIRDSHCWAISLERCAKGTLRDLEFASSQFKMIDGVRRTILNQDGIDLRMGCHDIAIENITGYTGDDLVALTAIPGKGRTAGGLVSTMVSASANRGQGLDDIHHVTIKNIQGWCRGGHHIVRLLNTSGIKLHDIAIDGLTDTSPADARARAALKIGDKNPAWGGVTPLGDTFGITVRNVTSRAQHAVLIAGSLADSTISNVAHQGSAPEPVTMESGPQYVRKVTITNARTVPK